jgi:Alpha-L-fucosidase
MNRRELLARMLAVTTGTLAQSITTPLFAVPAAAPATRRTRALAEYERLRLGVSFHFSMNTFTGDDYETGSVPATTYNPTQLDVRQWIQVAHDLGTGYAVLTAEHMSGFCLWDSEGYDYDVAASGNKTDVVAAFVAVCREFGLRPGFYYCILDPHNEGKFDWNSPVPDSYYKLIKHHLTELHSRYRNTFYQLLDITLENFAGAAWELYRLIKSLSPNCISYESGFLSEPAQPRARVRTGKLAHGRHQYRRQPPAPGRTQSSHQFSRPNLLPANGSMDPDRPTLQTHAADA